MPGRASTLSSPAPPTTSAGTDALSTVKRALIEVFAGASVHMGDLNARLLLGHEIDLTEHSAAVGALVRVASRLGRALTPGSEGPSMPKSIPPSRPTSQQAADGVPTAAVVGDPSAYRT